MQENGTDENSNKLECRRWPNGWQPAIKVAEDLQDRNRSTLDQKRRAQLCLSSLLDVETSVIGLGFQHGGRFRHKVDEFKLRQNQQLLKAKVCKFFGLNPKPAEEFELLIREQTWFY